MVSGVAVRWTTGSLDGPDRAAEGFWQAVTGYGLSARRGPSVTLVPTAGDAYLRMQVVGAPPARIRDQHVDSPSPSLHRDVQAGSASPSADRDLQVGSHLDLHVDDVPGGARRAVGLGAAVLGDEGSLVRLRSPAGIVFCLVRWSGEAVRPRPATWPGGQRSLVDQMCLDIPDAVFDAEAGFWAALTGWERRHSPGSEFDHLARPAGMPLRLLLQRIGTAVAGMHLDLACDGVPAEVDRQVALGATVVRVTRQWTTLRDPAGREYCVTGRAP